MKKYLVKLLLIKEIRSIKRWIKENVLILFYKILEYILDMLSLRKSMDMVVDDFANKNFKLVTAKDKSFKSILDSI